MYQYENRLMISRYLLTAIFIVFLPVATAQAEIRLLSPVDPVVMVPELVTLLQSSDYDAQCEALIILRAMGEQAADAVPALIEFLQTTHDEWLAQEASRALVATKVYSDEVINALIDVYPLIGSKLFYLLGTMGSAAKDTEPFLLECYAKAIIPTEKDLLLKAMNSIGTDQSTLLHLVVQERGIIGPSGGDLCLTWLWYIFQYDATVMLYGFDHISKEELVAHCSRDGIYSLVYDDMIVQLDSPDENQRSIAMRILGSLKLHPEIVIPKLLGLINKSQDYLDVVASITSFGSAGTETIPELVHFIAQHSSKAHLFAGYMAKFGKSVIPTYKEYLRFENSDTRNAILALIKGMNEGKEEFIPELSMLLEDPECSTNAREILFDMAESINRIQGKEVEE